MLTMGDAKTRIYPGLGLVIQTSVKILTNIVEREEEYGPYRFPY